MKTFILAMCFISANVFAGDWRNSEIDRIFDTLFTNGALAAAAEVETYGVTTYDFGFDLLEMGLKEKAHTWFSAHSQINNDLNFAFGKAWVEMELGNLLEAMRTANNLLSSSEGIAKARTHYLLGVIYIKSGSLDYGRNELNNALLIYTELSKNGGIDLCNRLLSSTKTIIIDFDPPRDDSLS